MTAGPAFDVAVDRQAVWSALGTVLDPELDEPITCRALQFPAERPPGRRLDLTPATHYL